MDASPASRYGPRMAGGWTIGIIGGSGLYAIDGLEDVQWIAIDTPWGAPSDEIMFGRLKDWRRVATRYDRCPETFFSAVALAATVLFWL